jgi:hypothetical protein
MKAVAFLLLYFCQMFVKHCSPVFPLPFYVCPGLPEVVHIHCEVVIVLIILCVCFNTALFDIKNAACYQMVLTAEMSADVKVTGFEYIVLRLIAR